MFRAYDEILDFVISAPTLEQIVAFQHSDETIARVRYLESAEHSERISHEEAEELREFRKSAYFIEQLKIRAQRRLQA